MINKKILVSAIGAALALSTWAGSVLAQEQTAPAPEQTDADREKARQATELEKVVVTGSLIPQAQLETASPVTTITAEDIQRQGFRNVSDVLRAQPLATGSVQDNQFAGFTSNATTISLLGLSPSFTLILLDGRPLADYPLLYNGASNFTDLTSIPTAMVERIDILPGNQSSIYGSAAIAGVVNIILKKRIEGMQLDFRLGGYQEGGGDNKRFQLTGGKSWDLLDITYGLQWSDQDPIYLSQRDFTDSTDDNPNPLRRFGNRTFIILNGFTNTYDDPGNSCDNVAANFGGTTFKDFRPGRGFFCGSRASAGSLLNQETNAAGYLNANFQLNVNTKLYGSLLIGSNKARNDNGSRFWIPNYNNTSIAQGYVWNATEATLETYQHIFSPEEMGDARFFNTKSDSYNLALGITGGFGDSNWDYDAYYSRSGYKVKSDQLWPLVDEMDAFFRNQFLGPQLGTYYGYPVYQPDKAAFYQSVTEQQFNSFSAVLRNTSKTWTQGVHLQINNGDLFELPAGSVGMAALLQVGSQYWDNPVDARITSKAFFGLTGTSGRGKRSNEAAAVEFRVPLLTKLIANLSARYDRYENKDAGGDAKATYKFGLEFRPIDRLLIRGNYATAFRAPDMGYVFTGGSGFFTSGINDVYKCEVYTNGGGVPPCPFAGVNIEGFQGPNPDLKSITADSFGFGFVWSPSRNFDLRADYYNVSIKDEVVPQSISRILQDEADCRAGRLDTNSSVCQAARAAITRAPVSGNPLLSETLLRVVVVPINLAQERVAGIIAGLNYRWDAGRAGKFTFGLDYNVTTDHTTRTFPEDPEFDLLHNPVEFLGSEFKTVLTGDISWQIGKWSSNLHGTRYGATTNYAGQFGGPVAFIAPYMLYNLNIDYQFTDNQRLTLTINNLRNSDPPRDPSFDGTFGFAPPYYNIFAYNGYGRAYWLQYHIDLGGGG